MIIYKYLLFLRLYKKLNKKYTYLYVKFKKKIRKNNQITKNFNFKLISAKYEKI
jgi:hypothetical protein